MTIPFARVAEKIADILMAANYKVEMYDDSGNLVYDKEAARKFFTHPGNHMIALHDEGNEGSQLSVSLSKPVDIKEFEQKVGKKLRAVVAQIGDNMSYDIRTFGKSLTPKDFAHETVREESQMTDKRVDEAFKKMTGTSRSSYQKIGECRLIIRHTGRINEDKHGARSRNIQAIYVETKAGERFRMVENSLHGARAMARHISNGGTPFDTVGDKITEMMTEMASLRDMVKEARALRKNEPLSEDAGTLVEQIRGRYIEMRETLRKMTGKVGYYRQTEGLREGETLDEYEYRDRLSGAVATTLPPTGGHTSGDQERMLWQAAKDWGEKRGFHVDLNDPSGSELAGVLNSEAFKISPEYQQHMRRMGESDEFDDIMVHEYEDEMDPESGTKKYSFDLGSLRQLEPMKQLSMLMAEVLSPKPTGNPEVDAVKKEVEALSDEEWNYWSRVSDKLTHGDSLDKQEQMIIKQAAEMFTNAGIGQYNTSDTAVTPMESKDPWGKRKSSDMEDKILDRMSKGKGSKQVATGKSKERERDKYDDMARKHGLESVQEAEEEGKITSSKQKHTYVSNVAEFDRSTKGKVDKELPRDNAESMHSENLVDVTKEGGKQKEYPLPEQVIESWFDDMVRVDFFNEEEESEDETVEETTKKKSVDIDEALDNLNISLNEEEFDTLLKEYEKQKIVDNILELVEEDSRLWSLIQERRPFMTAINPEEQKLEKAFAELQSLVMKRTVSLEQAIQDLSKEFADPEGAALELHQMARETGLEKGDFGSTQADDILSPNQEIAQGKEENEVEEFYGTARFESEELARIQKLAGIEEIHEENHEELHEGLGCGCAPDCKCAGNCDGKCGDENCPCECGERTGKGLDERRLSNVVLEEIEPDPNEMITDQNLAKVIYKAKHGIQEKNSDNKVEEKVTDQNLARILQLARHKS